MRFSPFVLAGALACAGTALASVGVQVDHRTEGSSAFRFSNVPTPSRGDAAEKGKFTIVDGAADANGASVDALNDGRLPSEEDQPGSNFFFSAGSTGGRLLLDLTKAISVQAIRSYSWHPGGRAPQVYTVYGSDGAATGFNKSPRRGTEPEAVGWKKIGDVSAHAKEEGGQFAVQFSDDAGALGKFQFLLFDVATTTKDDPFGQTFFSEIDVIDADAPAGAVVAAAEQRTEVKQVVEFKGPDGTGYTFTFDTSVAPDLTEWTENNLIPVVKEWYPRIVAMLPSEGYTALTNVTVRFRDNMNVPASAGGNMINCSATWFRSNLKGEAVGSVVHEMVHTVQQYGRARRAEGSPRARTPGWIVEGIPDYIRWFLYEPHTHGADITPRNIARAKYDASYRVTGNFLDWASRKFDTNLVRKLNAAARDGKYSDEVWKEATGKTAAELGEVWLEDNKERLAKIALLNQLSDDEKGAGWKSLFNGTNFAGWSNFKSDKIRPGWQVREGTLVCEDPHNAGDLVTADEFAWFELQLEYNITPAGNSGIMYRVSKEGNAAWASGPEFQLEDNAAAKDPQRCGWLYGLYTPPIDPKTNKPLDATKPAGEWNTVRLVIAPDKCFHEINGVRYFEYVLGSEDFNARVAKSKFAKMPLFAKAPQGSIALQGDHGQISFRNIRIREIKGQ
jgi:hypothetical protein